MNLVESIARATDYLERHGVASPRLNSELLLGFLLSISRVEIYTNYDRPLSDRETALYRELLVKRAGGYPLQYLTGQTGFRGLVFEVRPGVFIPRPETEVLVDRVLEVLPAGEAQVLDLGAGCGNVAVCVAVEHEGAKVTAVDNNPLALELCERNAGRHGVGERVETLEGDLYGALAPHAYMFDVIASNPPYIREGRREDLDVEVREFEPAGALLGGFDGLDVARRIVDGAPARLKDGGWLVFELDESQVEEASSNLLAGWGDIAFFNDLAGRVRVVRARPGGRATRW